MRYRSARMRARIVFVPHTRPATQGLFLTARPNLGAMPGGTCFCKQKHGTRHPDIRLSCEARPSGTSEAGWRRADSNRQPRRCKRRALPVELRPRLDCRFPIGDCRLNGNTGTCSASNQIAACVAQSEIANRQSAIGMGLAGVEPATLPLSGARSNQLSYKPAPSGTRHQPSGTRREPIGPSGSRRVSPTRAACCLLPAACCLSSFGSLGFQIASRAQADSRRMGAQKSHPAGMADERPGFAPALSGQPPLRCGNSLNHHEPMAPKSFGRPCPRYTPRAAATALSSIS